MAVIDQSYDAHTDLTVLLDHPRNPRRGDDESVEQSLDSNGWYGAIIAQHGTNHILAGHTRRRALVKAGKTHGPVIWVDCDEDTATRILLADNRTAENARWDFPELLDVLRDVAMTDTGLEGAGFTEDDLADLVERFGEPPSLDSLADEHGEPDDGALWPVLRLQLPPETFARYRSLVETMDELPEHDQFERVVSWAENGQE